MLFAYYLGAYSTVQERMSPVASFAVMQLLVVVLIKLKKVQEHSFTVILMPQKCI